MLIYKQRYKPRTTREFTKSDLTVYDSAGNTALNALTVYGKSEVVNGAIVSAGDSGSIEVQTYTGTNQFGGLDFATALNNASYTSTIDTVNKTVTFNHAPNENPNIILYSGRFKENTVYSFILTCNVMSAGNNSSLIIYYTDGTQQQIYINKETKQTVKTVSSINKTIKGFGLSYYGDTLSILYYDECGIFEGDIAVSAFEPYTGTMATFTTGTPLRGIPDTTVRDIMTWDGSAGTVTKVCDEVDLSQLEWIYLSAYTVFGAVISGMKIATTGQERVEGIISSRYPVTTNYISTAQMDNKSMMKDINSSYLYIKDTDYTDATAFKNSLNGVKLVYELATPTNTPLTPTENASFAALETYNPQTHAQNNAQTDMTVDYTIRVPTI